LAIPGPNPPLLPGAMTSAHAGASEQAYSIAGMGPAGDGIRMFAPCAKRRVGAAGVGAGRGGIPPVLYVTEVFASERA
jgi:hypothetical protein